MINVFFCNTVKPALTTTCRTLPVLNNYLSYMTLFARATWKVTYNRFHCIQENKTVNLDVQYMFFFACFYWRLWKKNSLAEFCLFVCVCLFRLMFFFDNIEKPHDDCTCAHVYMTNVRRSTTPLRTATSCYWRIFRPWVLRPILIVVTRFLSCTLYSMQRIIAMQFLCNPLFFCNTVYTVRHH